MTDDDPNDITDEVRESLQDGDAVGDSDDESDDDGALLTLDEDSEEGDEE